MNTRTLVFLGLGLLCMQVLHGQESVTHTVTLKLENVTSIRLKPGSSENTEMKFSTADQYKDGVQQDLAAVYQVRSNRPWVVNVRAASDYFEYEGLSNITKEMPSEVLSIRRSTSSESKFTPINTKEYQIAQGDKGTYEHNEFGIDYQADPKYEYEYGDYSLGVVYTVSNP